MVKRAERQKLQALANELMEEAANGDEAAALIVNASATKTEDDFRCMAIILASVVHPDTLSGLNEVIDDPIVRAAAKRVYGMLSPLSVELRTLAVKRAKLYVADVNAALHQTATELDRVRSANNDKEDIAADKVAQVFKQAREMEEAFGKDAESRVEEAKRRVSEALEPLADDQRLRVLQKVRALLDDRDMAAAREVFGKGDREKILPESWRTPLTPTPVLNELAEINQAALDTSHGDYAKWKDHGAQAVKRHGHTKPVDEVVQWCCMKAVEASEAIGIDPRQLATEAVPFYAALFMWARDGYPHFNLTSDFFHAVAVTDFGDPTEEPLHLPFDSFVLSFPKTDVFAQASRAFIYKVPSAGWDQGKFHIEWKLRRATLLTDDPIFTQWPMGFTRKQVLDESNMLNRTSTSPGVRAVDADETPLLSKLRAMLANVMTYIESSGPLPTKARERKAVPVAVERIHPEKPLYDVGRVVKLDGGLRRAMMASEGDRARWKLAQKFIVRGHWRNQAHGPGRTLHRRQWIAPFWKGPENVVEALSRTYEVTT